MKHVSVLFFVRSGFDSAEAGGMALGTDVFMFIVNMKWRETEAMAQWYSWFLSIQNGGKTRPWHVDILGSFQHKMAGK